MCPEDCEEPCAIRVLRQAAEAQGYKGVCVAPGGSMVLRFIEQTAPEAIVAVACQKELEEGIHGVRELADVDRPALPIAIVPLAKDGCVDTEVDVEQALETITLGCSLELVKGR